MPGGGQIDHLCMTKLLRSLDKYVSKYFTFSEPTAICGTITYYLLICRCNDLWCLKLNKEEQKRGMDYGGCGDRRPPYARQAAAPTQWRTPRPNSTMFLWKIKPYYHRHLHYDLGEYFTNLYANACQNKLHRTFLKTTSSKYKSSLKVWRHLNVKPRPLSKLEVGCYAS